MITVSYIKSILPLALCALMWSCNEGVADHGKPPVTNSANIAFSAKDDRGYDKPNTLQAPASRATSDGAFEAGDQIGILAYYIPEGKDIISASPDFMYNQPITLTGEGWNYSPTKYWPANGTLSFFAYYPHNASGITLPANTDAGYPVIHYEASNADTDLLAATPLLNQSFGTNNGAVTLSMNHTLTRVDVYVKSTDDVVEKTVKSFSIQGVKRGTLSCYAPVTAQDKGFNWTYPSPIVMEKFSAAVTDLSVPASSTAAKQLLGTLFLLPKGAGNTFDITYTYTGTNGMETIILKDQPLPALDKWQPGSFLSYTIGIDNKVGASVTADLYPSWGSGNSETVNGEIVK